MDPYRHDHASHDKQPAEPAGAREYSCPMHPEVRQDTPGDCPKCGMHLAAVGGDVPESQHTHSHHHHGHGTGHDHG